MKKLYLTTALISLSACLAPLYAANGYGGTTRQPILSVTVERAILCFDPAKADQAKTTISAAPLNFPEGAHLTYEWKQVQDEMLPAAAIMAKKPIRFSVTNKPSTVATFPANGVYEVQVTVTDTRTKKWPAATPGSMSGITSQHWWWTANRIRLLSSRE